VCQQNDDKTMTNDDIWGEMALFWGDLSLKTAQSEIRTTTNDDK
jgi:hypothetical protein